MSQLIGFRIRDQRKKMRFTQKQLAERVSVSPQVVSNWERGYTEPSAEDISCLSEALDCPGDYLLGKNVDTLVNGKKVEQHLEQDIAKKMEEIREDLSSESDLLFDGQPMSETTKESLLEAMEFAIRLVKKSIKNENPNDRDKEE